MTGSSRIIVVSCVAAMVACALVTNLDSLGGGDAATTCNDDGGACAALALPDGWTPIAYHEGFVGCPAGFASQKYGTQPTAVCGCSCTATPPSCENAIVETFYGSSCATSGLPINPKNGNCDGTTIALQANFAAKPGAPTGGTCSPTSVTIDAAVTSAEACISSCAEDLCRGIAPAGYKACALADGSVACPQGTPFSVPTIVGTSATADCTGTCTTCVAGGTCTNAKVELFSDGVCGTPIATFTADGTCQATGASGKVAQSTKYTAQANGECEAGAPATGDASLVGLHTVCCVP